MIGEHAPPSLHKRTSKYTISYCCRGRGGGRKITRIFSASSRTPHHERSTVQVISSTICFFSFVRHTPDVYPGVWYTIPPKHDDQDMKNQPDLQGGQGKQPEPPRGCECSLFRLGTSESEPKPRSFGCAHRLQDTQGTTSKLESKKNGQNTPEKISCPFDLLGETYQTLIPSILTPKHGCS